MKKSFKNIFVIVLSFLCVLCMCMGILNVTTAKAQDSVEQTEYFKIYDGAWIRAESPVGIRFEIGFLKSYKEAIPEPSNITFGTLIVPKDLYNGTLDLSNENALKIPTVNWVTTAETGLDKSVYDVYFGTLVGPEATEGGFTDFEEKYYGTAFVACGYITDGTNEEYTATIERTIGGIAEKAVAVAKENEQTPDAMLESIVEKTDKIKLTYDLNDGSTLEEKEVVKGHILSVPTTPERNGYEFKGWYTDADCTTGNEFSFEGILMENKTVYAKWAISGVSKYSLTNVAFHNNTSNATLDKTTYDSKSVWKYTSNSDNPNSCDTRHIYTDVASYTDFIEGNYFALEFLFENTTGEIRYSADNVLCTYYDADNNEVAESNLKAGVWYKAVGPCTFTEDASMKKLLITALEYKYGTVYFGDLYTYTQTAFDATFTSIDELWTEKGIAKYTANTSTIGYYLGAATYCNIEDYTFEDKSVIKYSVKDTVAVGNDSQGARAIKITPDEKLTSENYIALNFYIAQVDGGNMNKGADYVHFIDHAEEFTFYNQDKQVVDKNDITTGQWYTAVAKIIIEDSAIRIGLFGYMLPVVYISDYSVLKPAAYTTMFGAQA